MLSAAALAVVLAGTAPLAAAAGYSNADYHYSFAYPDGWAQEQNSNVDAAVLGPSSGGFRPNIVSQHEEERSAQNTAAWLFNYVANSFRALQNQMNVTEVEGPRTFTTGTGRLAGDFVFDRVASGIPVRQRQVFFVSEFHHLAYFITLSDKTSTFAGHSSDWSQAVDSFAVSGEANVMGQLPLLAAVAAAGAVAVVGGVVVHRKRARTKSSAPGPSQQ